MRMDDSPYPLPERDVRATLGVLDVLTSDLFRYATQQPATPTSIPLLPEPKAATPGGLGGWGGMLWGLLLSCPVLPSPPPATINACKAAWWSARSHFNASQHAFLVPHPLPCQCSSPDPDPEPTGPCASPSAEPGASTRPRPNSRCTEPEARARALPCPSADPGPRARARALPEPGACACSLSHPSAAPVASPSGASARARRPCGRLAGASAHLRRPCGCAPRRRGGVRGGVLEAGEPAAERRSHSHHGTDQR